MTDNPDSSVARRHFLRGGSLAALGALAGYSGRTAMGSATPTEADEGGTTEVTVTQDPDQLVYWVPPGPRRLSETVFGTPDDPKSLVEPVIERAKQPPVKQLLREFPILVGVPPDKRVAREGRYVRTAFPTPFSDDGEIIDGEFDLTYVDCQPKDTPKKPTKTEDSLELRNVRFTDPQRNEYRLELKTMFQPPIPGYKTGGGVFTDRYHHGLTGTGSPLMPKVYTWGASYSLGNVVANGEVVDKRKVVHWMTTQTVRTKNYRLAIDEELPLAPEETIAGQVHHTHLIVLPVTITKTGKPKFEPVDMPFDAPGGKKQPFIHVMYEEDEVVEAPFEPPDRITAPTAATPTGTPATPAEGAITVRGSEYFFEPHRVVVQKGEEVTITFVNAGSIAHNFTIGELGVRTPTILPGGSASVTFTPEKAHVYGFWCNVPGHQDAGMQGRLIVEEQADQPPTPDSQ